MSSHIKAFACIVTALLLATPLLAKAEIYKCTIDGKVTFRDKQCPDVTTQSVVHQHKDAFAGCYGAGSAKGGAENADAFRLRVVALGSGTFNVSFPDESGGMSEPLLYRRATSGELVRMTEFTGIRLEAALVVGGFEPDPRLSLLQYTDAYNDTLFRFPMVGEVKRIACP